MRHEGVGTGATFDAVADLLLASEIPGYGRLARGYPRRSSQNLKKENDTPPNIVVPLNHYAGRNTNICWARPLRSHVGCVQSVPQLLSTGRR
jgi:hypothetical protein